MNIVIAGAGTVGRHLAEVLSAGGKNVTVIDCDPEKLEELENELDVRTLKGNCAHGDTLREAGVASCDMYIAATSHDEINLLSASAAKGIGAEKSVARVHHSAYFDGRGLDYRSYFRIDSLICPEYETAVAIARTLRNPGATVVERFAGDKIELQELEVSEGASAVGIPLSELKLPRGVRLAAVTRNDGSFIPTATTVIQGGDVVTVIGETGQIDPTRKMLQKGKATRLRVVIMGGTSMSVWLGRSLRQRHFAVRIFLDDRARAVELADKLSHVTVIEADPTEPVTFAEERINEADAFVAVTNDDEHNILAAAQAKSLGCKKVIAVIARSTYLHLLEHVGIDRAFSPRIVAARELQNLLESGPVRVPASLVEATADVYEIHVGESAAVVGQSLRSITMPGPCVVGAIQRDHDVFVPGAEDAIKGGDKLLLIGARGLREKLQKTFVDT